MAQHKNILIIRDRKRRATPKRIHTERSMLLVTPDMPTPRTTSAFLTLAPWTPHPARLPRATSPSPPFRIASGHGPELSVRAPSYLCLRDYRFPPMLRPIPTVQDCRATRSFVLPAGQQYFLWGRRCRRQVSVGHISFPPLAQFQSARLRGYITERL
jgi:hypothetical protein